VGVTARLHAVRLERQFGRAPWTVPNGVPDLAQGGSEDALVELGLVPGRYVLHVGRAVPEKRQDDLIKARMDAGVHALRPGITGWAQVNGRDELPIPDKVALDAAYLRQRSFSLDLRILWMTLWKVVRRDGVSH
jgi:O-antigen biosynthesis protein WbqP